MSEKAYLLEQANRVRHFLETDGVEMTNLFADFPAGSCGNASNILAVWLSQLGELNIEYVNGDRKEKSHGWLEQGNLLIDITSDQFGDGLGKVYVGELNSFHKSFNNLKRSTPGFSPLLRPVYERMKELFEKDC